MMCRHNKNPRIALRFGDFIVYLHPVIFNDYEKTDIDTDVNEYGDGVAGSRCGGRGCRAPCR